MDPRLRGDDTFCSSYLTILALIDWILNQGFTMENDIRYHQAKKVTLIGAAVNGLLGVIKLLGGVVFHSHALIADGLHSFADLVTDIMVVFASKYGSQDADAAHPYGHQRIETAATFLLALLLILAGAGIAWDSLDEIIHRHHNKPGLLALPIAALSILANEALFHYTHHVGRRIRSDLIIANAWHHRSDAASSIVVLIGLVGSWAGWAGFDALAAVVVGGLIIQMGLSYGYNSIKELVDTAIEPALLAEIEQAIQHIDGVQKIHQLRTRMMGGDIFIDLHILVSPNISVSEGHFIAQHVHLALINQFERVKDVTVHVDPEDDELNSPSLHLPSRRTLEWEWLQKWQDAYPCIQAWNLHYLNGTLSIELICESPIPQEQDLCKRICDDLVHHPHISSVRLLSENTSLAILHADIL